MKVGVQCADCRKVMGANDRWEIKVLVSNGKRETVFTHRNKEECNRGK